MGYFWLPDRPAERVPGRLTFSTADGGSLSLIGELAAKEVELSRVLGEAEGNSYTLEDCLMALWSRGHGKQVLDSWPPLSNTATNGNWKLADSGRVGNKDSNGLWVIQWPNAGGFVNVAPGSAAQDWALT